MHRALPNLPIELWEMVFDHLFDFHHELEVNFREGSKHPTVTPHGEEDAISSKAVQALTKHNVLFEHSRHAVMSYLVPRARWTIRITRDGLQVICTKGLEFKYQRPIRYLRIICPKVLRPGTNGEFNDYVDICRLFKGLHSVHLVMNVGSDGWAKSRYSVSSSDNLRFLDDAGYVLDTINQLSETSPPESRSTNPPSSIFQQIQEHCGSLQVFIRDKAPRAPGDAHYDIEQLKWQREEDITFLLSLPVATEGSDIMTDEALALYLRHREGRKIRREDGTTQVSYLARLAAGLHFLNIFPQRAKKT